MKIGVISSTVFAVGRGGTSLQGYGGLEAIAWERAKGLAKKGHDVTLFAPDGSECPGVNIVPFGPEQQISESQAYAGYPEIKEGDVLRRRASRGYWPELLQQDVIIDDSWQKYSYLLKQEGRLKAPILGVMHAPVNTMFQSPPPVEKPCIVCISEDQKNHYEALFSPHKAKVALHGIDLDFYKPLDIPRSKRFLFLARFSSVKCPDLAIQACRQAGVGLDLVGDTKLTGEGEYLQSIRSMCDGDGKDGSRIVARDQGRDRDGNMICIVGPASRGETVWWYSQAHCMVHPIERFREPFGLAPVEAMASGCPVIAWDYGAMRETIEHGMRSSDGKGVDGGTGFLVRSMEELVQTIKFCSEIPDSARKRCREWVASKFSLQHMIDRWHDLVTEAKDTGGW